MRQVRRELEREERVVEVQHITHVGTDRRVRRQLEQAAVVIRQTQLTRRTQHAETLDTAQLAHIDLERRDIGRRIGGTRQLGAHQRQRHADARPRVRRTAHHLQQASGRMRARIDAANLQLVGVRMRRCGHDGADDDAVERGRHRAQRFDLHARHRQQLGQGRGRQRRIAEGAQPAFGELHRCLAQRNCDRKRRSPSKNRRRSATP